MVLQPGRDIDSALGIQDPNRVTRLCAGSGAGFLGSPTVAALHVAPEVYRLTLDSDRRPLRLCQTRDNGRQYRRGDEEQSVQAFRCHTRFLLFPRKEPSQWLPLLI